MAELVTQDPTPAPESPRPEPVVLDRAAPSEPDETRLRQYVRDRYGIEDDPDAYQVKRAQWAQAEQAAALVPQYEAALRHFMSQTPASAPAAPAAPAPPAPDDGTPVTRAQLKQLNEYWQSTMARVAREMDERVATHLSTRELAAVARRTVEEEYPEAFEPGSELNKLAAAIWEGYPPAIQQHPDASRMAAEQAAGRLGIGPKSRRTPAGPPPAARQAAVAAQSADKGGRRSGEPSESVSLTAQDKRLMESMGLTDERAFRAAKAARAAGKNLVAR